MPDLTQSSPLLERSVQCIAYLGVALIGFDVSPYGPAPMSIGTSLLLAGLPLLYWRGLSIRFKDPLIILIIVLAGWALLRGGADLLFPFMDPVHYEAESWWYHFRSSGILALLVGLWIYAVPGSALLGIGAMIAGLLIHPWHLHFWTELIPSLSGHHRLRLTENPHFISKYAGIMVLTGTLFFFYGVYFAINIVHRRASWIMILFSLYLLPFYLLLFWATKSRLGWIAGATTFVVLTILMVRKVCSIEPANKRNIIYWVSGLVFLVVLLSLPFSHTVTSRFMEEYHNLKALASLQLDEIEVSSLGKRVLMWQAAARDISEYPLRGWGPGFVNRVCMLSENENISATKTHNTYIQFAVSMGLIWTAIWIAFHVLLLARAAKTTNNLNWNAFIAEIGLIMSLIFLIAGFAQFRLHSSEDYAMYFFGTSLLIGVSLMKSPYQTSGSRPSSEI